MATSRARTAVTVVSSLMAGSSVAIVAGCGDITTATVTVTAPASVAGATSAVRGAVGRTSRTKPATVFVRCDRNIEAKAGTTTCPFAQNTFYEYFVAGEASVIRVYSPATRIAYRTRCTAGVVFVICRTADSGAVKFPQAAIDAYSRAQADAYRARHDVGADTGGDAAPSSPSPDAAEPSGDGCSSEYSGPCVPGDVGDVDCGELAESDFESVGSDPYGLDRDGDGIACES